MPTPLAALALASQLSRPAGAARDPDAFVRAIYAHFDRGGTGVHPAARTAGRWFDPAMTALVKADVRQARGEVPMLDGDPFCDCQDVDRVSYVIETKRSSQERAVSQVRFKNGATSSLFRLDLSLTPAGWRVSDVHGPTTPSLKRFLEQGLRSGAAR